MMLISTGARDRNSHKCYKAIPTLRSVAHQAIAVRRALEVNHSFLQDILAKED